MQLFKESNFDDVIDDYLYGDQKPSKKMLGRAGLKIKKYLEDGEMNDIFPRLQKKSKLPNIFLHQTTEYVQFFFVDVLLLSQGTGNKST